jgi:hypothetical protein
LNSHSVGVDAGCGALRSLLPVPRLKRPLSANSGGSVLTSAASHFAACAHSGELTLLISAGAGRAPIPDVGRAVGKALRASASHGYRIDGQWVPETYGFTISPAAATFDAPLYRYPFYSLAYVTLAANIAGMAGHFIRLARACLGHRRHGGSGLRYSTCRT